MRRFSLIIFLFSFFTFLTYEARADFDLGAALGVLAAMILVLVVGLLVAILYHRRQSKLLRFSAWILFGINSLYALPMFFTDSIRHYDDYMAMILFPYIAAAAVMIQTLRRSPEAKHYAFYSGLWFWLVSILFYTMLENVLLKLIALVYDARIPYLFLAYWLFVVFMSFQFAKSFRKLNTELLPLLRHLLIVGLVLIGFDFVQGMLENLLRADFAFFEYFFTNVLIRRIQIPLGLMLICGISYHYYQEQKLKST